MLFVLTDYLVFILINELKDKAQSAEYKFTTYNIKLIIIYYTCELRMF